MNKHPDPARDRDSAGLRGSAWFWSALAAALFGVSAPPQPKAAQNRRSPKPSEWRRRWQIQRFLVGGAACGALLFASSGPAEPYLPHDGSQVLERLRTTVLDPGARELRELRAALAADSQNLGLAAQYARKCIERSRSDADPRYLGRAQAALAPWWNAPAAPTEALVLRATIRQSQHDFTNALADLELALKTAPRDAQAWLIRATILTVQGNYAAARRSCSPLAQLAPGLVALTAAASVACLNGDAERGCSLLRNALEAHSEAGNGERVWALTVLGEALARLGHDAAAEQVLREALELAPRDPYLQCSYADFLLDRGRDREAAALLKDEVRASITLSLAAIGAVQLPSKLIESAIAASVVLAALNNLAPFFSERGWVVAFGFGLLHGFGFANALRDLGLQHGQLALTLFGFNLGVELGQLVIVALFLPLALSLRRVMFYPRIVLRLGSTAISAISATWLAERVLDFKWLPF